jgi:hypothetical protein
MPASNRFTTTGKMFPSDITSAIEIGVELIVAPATAKFRLGFAV